ncbi:hypothetical protein NY547_13020 [Cnuibacter physcomitrellae]|uniref:hypothetical protein n=1 Tax=Cnuibacter physcomitrellae TaxID=1619308 RepID=UPI002175BD39|nr:hypothetical protein [Cnuibacter physcomitrellae]MCS5498166.1 hypothetical protein [Cnuibacter physcomitrellae]
MSDQNAPEWRNANGLRRSGRQRLVNAARAELSASSAYSLLSYDELAAKVGMHPHAIRTMFPEEDDLLDAVNDLLVEECVTRLRHAIDQFEPEPTEDGRNAFLDASVCIARAQPIDRSSLIIRAQRRLLALRRYETAAAVVEGERRYALGLTDVLEELVRRLRRRFRHPSAAIRLIIGSYERSYEAWLIGGGADDRFHESPFVQTTLPELLRDLTADPRE